MILNGAWPVLPSNWSSRSRPRRVSGVSSTIAGTAVDASWQEDPLDPIACVARQFYRIALSTPQAAGLLAAWVPSMPARGWEGALDRGARDTARAMSERHVRGRAAFEAAERRREPEATLDFLDPAIVWEVRSDLPDAETYTGHDGFRRLLAAFDEVLDHWYRPVEFIQVGGQVVVPLRWGGRGKVSGAASELSETLGFHAARWEGGPRQGVR